MVVFVCDTDDSSALNSFMLNWSPICDISVSPVVDDASLAVPFRLNLTFKEGIWGSEKK